jgi:hypothetical protein
MNTKQSLWEDMKDIPLTATLIIIASIGLVYFFTIISLQFFMSPERVDIYADIFSKLAIGFGAMSAGLGGFRFLSQYFEYEKATVRKKEYMNLYPPHEFTDRYDIVNRKSKKRELYLRDKQEKNVRHIENGSTYNELGWKTYKIITLDDKDFEQYNKEERILI